MSWAIEFQGPAKQKLGLLRVTLPDCSKQNNVLIFQVLSSDLCLLEICLASLVQSSNSSSLASEHKEKTAEKDWHGMGSLWFLRLWMDAPVLLRIPNRSFSSA